MQELLNYFIQTPTALYMAIGILSLCIGSFLNVVIYRTPKMMENEWHEECQMLLHPEQAIIDEEKLSLSKPASTCPKCSKPIHWYQNVPVLSWLALRGKCGSCQNSKDLNSCKPCSEFFECVLRKRYVITVYESMNKGSSGGFEF